MGIQATLDEFRALQKVTEGGETMLVMRVARHKTSRQGSAHVVMTMDDYKLTRNDCSKAYEPHASHHSQVLPGSNWEKVSVGSRAKTSSEKK